MLLVALCGCAPATSQAAPAVDPQDFQTQAFIAGLEHLMVDFAEVLPVPIDPHPILFVERLPPRYASSDASAIALRESLIRQRGLEMTALFPGRADCGGTLSPPSAHTGCPQPGNVERRVGFALAEQVPGQPVWTLPRVTIVYTRFGSVTTITGLTLELVDGSWAGTGEAYTIYWE